MRQGHIKISRKMFDGSDLFWSEKRKFSRAEAWIDLIQMAAWRDGTPYTSAAHEADILARGELVASLRYLAVRWQWSKNTVSRYLDAAEKAGRLEGQRMGHHGRVYLLVNYATYQGNGPADGTGDDAEDGTVVGQSWDDRGTVVGQRRSSKAVKQESSTTTAPSVRAAGAPAAEAEPPAMPVRVTLASADVESVLQHYAALHPRSRPFNDNNRKRVRARLRDGYTVDDCKAAIEGNASDPYCQEHCLTDLEFALRPTKIAGHIQRHERDNAPAVDENGELTAVGRMALGIR